MAKSKHDSFFSRSLEHPSIAKSFLEQHMPSYLKKHIYWQDLRRLDRTNTDATLKKLHRDFMYRLPTDQLIDVIAGVEHQSKDDVLMHIRYLRYNLQVVEAYIKKDPTKWPLIVNILLYNGPKSPYPYPSETSNYYATTAWGRNEMYARFHLLDLTKMSDKQLLTHGLCAPMEVLLKHCHDGNFEEHIEAYKRVFNECITEIGDDYIVSMLEYASSLKDYEIGKKMYKFVEEVFQNKQEVIMTYGQILKREAKKEGRKEGMELGIQTKAKVIAKNMLAKGYAIKDIEEITGLSREAIEKLKQE